LEWSKILQVPKRKKKMAKRPKAVTVNVALLNAIATAEAQGGFGRVTKPEADGLAGLIMVDPSDIVEDKAAARLSDEGKQYLSNLNNPTKESTGKPMYGIITNAVIPPSNRGNRKGAGAPTVYPFATMEIGHSFFVPNSEKADAAKKLQSTVSAQNMKYSVETGETEQATRTKRGKGNKAVLDPATGEKVTETYTKKLRKPTRKYVLRPVTKGVSYGEWVAPDDGALIAREA
jgi:hypothetical protein